MAGRLSTNVEIWCDFAGIPRETRPDRAKLERAFPDGLAACRPGISLDEIAGWEDRHGYSLPEGLKFWLSLSNGLFAKGPLIHPLSAIGPMVLFAKVPGLIVQPESWFELGNPNRETICIDLGYRRSNGGRSIFTSGDDERETPARVISVRFEDWLLDLLRSGGREFWFDDAADLGDPWVEHVQSVPMPILPEPLLFLVDTVAPLIMRGVDERAIASRFRIGRSDVESLIRYVQHVSTLSRGSLAPRFPAMDLVSIRETT